MKVKLLHSMASDIRMKLSSQPIPSVWDENPKRMGRESQAYGTEIPSVWDDYSIKFGFVFGLF